MKSTLIDVLVSQGIEHDITIVVIRDGGHNVKGHEPVTRKNPK